MPHEGLLAAVRQVREHARGLGLKPSPIVSLSADARRLGVDVEAALAEAKRRTEWRIAHEIVEATWNPGDPDILPRGREWLCGVGATEILAPEADLRAAVSQYGWDLFLAKCACPEASYAVVGMAFVLLASERDDVVLFSSLVDNGRIVWRETSTAPAQRCRVLFREEAQVWHHHLRQDERQVTEADRAIEQTPHRLIGSRPPMPDPEPRAAHHEDDVEPLAQAHIAVWPIPLNPAGDGPRREIIVTTIEQ